MRSIKAIHKAISAPMGNLATFRAMPTNSINHLDPFLFLNHHGPQLFPPHNQGLPFGPHPHRGFETLTIVLQGDIVHKDTTGAESVIRAGGIQWMTAGSGIIHSEVSSAAFMEQGGMEEVLQLWLNLPAKLKMTPPAYTGLQTNEIPSVVEDHEKVRVQVIAGSWTGTQGAINSLTGLSMFVVHLQAGGKFTTQVDVAHEILFYIAKGSLAVNQQQAALHNLVVFADNAETIEVEALTDSILIFGHGLPYNEPIVAHGPFVMNTYVEIDQAIQDYQTGKMGVWR